MPLLPNCRSFYDSLVQFTKQKSVQKGKSLHAQILKTGASSSIYITNCLINFYAKCGHLSKAKLIFDNSRNKDVVSWNCLINGFSQQGPTNSYIVLELFRRMRAENTLPNAHTFAGIFAAASSLSSICAAQQAHAIAIKTDSFYDVFVGSSLLNVYCKAGLIFESRKVFNEMPERNLVSWTTMISGYAGLRMAEDAFRCFELMRFEGVELSEFVITSMLSALADHEFVDCGMEIHCLGVKNGLISFVSVVNALVTMYAKCGNLDYSLRMFEFSNDKDAITWSAMVTGYAQSGNSHQALKLFSKMHFAGICPSEFTLVGVLNACSDCAAAEEGKQVHGYLIKLGFESQIYIITALTDMYAKCGCIAEAQKGFSCLEEPDIVLWTSMMAGYVQNGENEDALNLFCRMRMNEILPNELTLASVLKACSSLTALDQGKQIHACTVKYGFGTQVSIGSALSTMYSKCGCLQEANIVFERLTERDIISWNAMISGLSHNGCGKEALELFEQMRLEGSKPDHVTFVNILSVCSHLGLVEKGWEYFRMMSDEYGIVPAVEHYACMVDILSRAGKLTEAKEFIEAVKIDHGMYLWRILLGACRNHQDYELGAYAGEKLMELGSQESSAYVLLSRIYTALHRPEDVKRVWSLMRLRGVSKEPGCSWIEIKSQVHAFVVGDQMHPLIGEIRTWIQRLSRQMKHERNQPNLDSVPLLPS